MITEVSIRHVVASIVDPLRSSVRGIVRRAVLDAFDDDGTLGRGAFSVTDADTDVVDEVEVVTQPGVSYRPRKGIEALLLALGASMANRVAFLIDRLGRLKDMDEGEVALYVGNEGQAVHLKADGSVVVSGKKVGGDAGGSITLKANGDIVAVPSATGKLLLGDDAATKKVSLVDELNTLRSAFNSHTHPTAPVGPVSTPSPVPAVIPVPAFAGATNVYGKG